MSCESCPYKGRAAAYIMGVYLSDGTLEISSGRFILGVTDIEFRDEVAKALDILGARYGLHTHRPRDGRRKPIYRLRELSPYRVGRWLEGLFPDGRDHLPQIPDALARELVAGILDGDGCISKSKKGIYRLLACGICWYLSDLWDLFQHLGVTMHYHPGEKEHIINLRSFVETGFYFKMPRKQALVEAYRKEFIK